MDPGRAHKSSTRAGCLAQSRLFLAYAFAASGTHLNLLRPPTLPVLAQRRVEYNTERAALGPGLQATGTTSHRPKTGAWRYGKRSAFPTSPHPRRRLRTKVKRGVILTSHLVQKTGQVNED